MTPCGTGDGIGYGHNRPTNPDRVATSDITGYHGYESWFMAIALQIVEISDTKNNGVDAAATASLTGGISGGIRKFVDKMPGLHVC